MSMYSTKPAIALIILTVPYFLLGITCDSSCGLIADAFHPQQPPLLRKTSLSRQSAITIPSSLVQQPLKQPIKTSSVIPALRASDINRSAPSEDSTESTAALKEDDEHDDFDDEPDELISSLTEKLERAEGMWYSDDFYGPHGREWVKVSATLIATTGTSALVAVKITGDPNVPAGCTTWRTSVWPEMGGGIVPAEICVRTDPNDPNGFSWVGGRLGLVGEDQIVLSANFSPFFETEGTFYKQNDDGDGG